MYYLPQEPDSTGGGARAIVREVHAEGRPAKVALRDLRSTTKSGGSSEATLRDYSESWSSQAVAKVREFRALQDGWDGRRAPAPSLGVVEESVALIVACDEVGLRLDRVLPDVNGGAGLYAIEGDRRAGFLVNNDGERSLVLRDGKVASLTQIGTGCSRSEAVDVARRFLATGVRTQPR